MTRMEPFLSDFAHTAFVVVALMNPSLKSVSALKSVVGMKVNNSGMLKKHHTDELIEDIKEMKENIQSKIFTASHSLGGSSAVEDFL